MTATSIEWTDEVWNFLRGCQRISPGCGTAMAGGCYAERQAIRHAYEAHTTEDGKHVPEGAYHGLVKSTPNGPRWTGVVRHVDDLLKAPLSWKKPRRVFVNSMSDLFHDSVPFEVLDRAFAVMALTPQHTYQILTKRPARMLEYMVSRSRSAGPWKAEARNLGYALEFEGLSLVPFPLLNVWLGVSVEDQQRADERIPVLLQTPAAVRWVSYEPALGPVDFTSIRVPLGGESFSTFSALHETSALNKGTARPALDWIVFGFESGPGARDANEAWARATRNQCVEAGAAFFYKQKAIRGRKIPTPELDGRRWVEMPGGAR